MRRFLVTMMLAGSLVAAIPGLTGATPSPNGPGQPGAPNTTCGNANTSLTPGNSATAQSPFNANGQSGVVYAGNPGTASLAHSHSSHAVSQYDIACFQVSSH